MSDSLVAKGQLCIATAVSAYNLISTKSDAKNASKQLSSLQHNAKYLQDLAREREQEMVIKEKQLKGENSTLESQKQGYDSVISKLKGDKISAECRLDSQQRALEENKSELSRAESRLSEAQSELRKAREHAETAKIASISGGIALGILTLGLGSIVGAVATTAAVTAAIIIVDKLKDKVKEVEMNVERKRQDISRKQTEISDTNKALSHVESEIKDHMQRLSHNETKMQETHDEISVVLKAIVFHKQAVEFWQLFILDSEHASMCTEKLKHIVDKAAKKENMKILRSSGTITFVTTFIEAWEEISVKQGKIM